MTTLEIRDARYRRHLAEPDSPWRLSAREERSALEATLGAIPYEWG